MIWWLYLLIGAASVLPFARALLHAVCDEVVSPDRFDFAMAAGLGLVAGLLWPLAWVIAGLAWWLSDDNDVHQTQEDRR